jgi:hypothetical protein
MLYTWSRQADTAHNQVVGAATAAPAATTAAPFSPQAAVPTEGRAQAGALLVELFEYLRANAEQHPALADAIPMLTAAVADFRTGQANDPFAGPRAVYAAIENARRRDPSIPEA